MAPLRGLSLRRLFVAGFLSVGSSSYAEMEIHEVRAAFDAWVQERKAEAESGRKGTALDGVEWWPTRKADGKVKLGPAKGAGGEVIVGVACAF